MADAERSGGQGPVDRLVPDDGLLHLTAAIRRQYLEPLTGRAFLQQR